MNQSLPSEDTLVPALEEDAYTALFDGHFWRLVRLGHLLGADDPEDLVQEAFVRLHRRRGSLREPALALGYLHATVCNLSRNRLRHLRVARRRRTDLALPPTTPSAESQVTQQESIKELLVAVERLPRRQREVIVLRYWLDLSERETAETLGISAGTVKAHAARAMATLTRKLDHQR